MSRHYPIFADLHDRPVLLVGAGHVAARKAEDLLRAGARLRVVARELAPVFQDWRDADRIEYLGTAFDPAQMDGVFLVVAATGDRALNARVFATAEAAGKLCNVVDTPQCCSYMVPALIDRAPLQIAISSAGTAPVLARHWRQQIELLLPRHLGALADIAGRWRARVKEAVRGTEARRRFWERLFASRFDTLVAQNRIPEAEAEIARQLAAQPAERGEVALVGAGPGDAGLLTIHAVQAMQAADIVFYDALVSDDIRALIRKDATQISVGKRAGAAQVAQGDIHALLIRHARAGRRVVRLKGGDPFVFGRGGEEAQALQAAGIPCRVIPGVTAALGATAYAGIPLTHRDHAQAVTFITGHGKGDRALHWPTLAQRRHTLVVYMGTLTAATLQRQLLAHGRTADTPMAVISNGTRAEQTVRVGTLARLAELAQDAPTPALLVIGETVALHAQLAWFGTRAERAA